MKYLIACLGNIGEEYKNTRHNIGFKIADAMAEESNIGFSVERYGSIAELKHKGRSITLLKPSTYMNLSGNAIHYWLQKQKIPLENLLVVLDDLAIPFGTTRLRNKGGDGGHNGLKHINEILGHSSYARLRLGIGSEFAKGMQVDYVLGEWTEDERAQLGSFSLKASDAIRCFVLQGVQRAMNIVNTNVQDK
ncbi:MAG: aminoacyl-tRNA hydrolase [Bacteroidales bacterium]